MSDVILSNQITSFLNSETVAEISETISNIIGHLNLKASIESRLSEIDRGYAELSTRHDRESESVEKFQAVAERIIEKLFDDGKYDEAHKFLDKFISMNRPMSADIVTIMIKSMETNTLKL